MEHRFLLCFFNFDFSIFGCIRSWLWLSLIVASGGYSPVVVLRLLTAVASLVAEHRI